MVNYTEYEIINEMIIQTEDLYLNCLECKHNIPSIFDFFQNESFLRYCINQKLYKSNYSEECLKYYKNLLDYPEGFGYYYIKYLNGKKINLTDIYFNLKIKYTLLYDI